MSNEKESNENLDYGYVSLFRSIKNHWLWKDSRKKTHLEAWIDLLLMACHKDQKEPIGYDLISIKRGQVLTSQLQLSKQWFWSRKAIVRFLKLLENDSMIVLKVSSKWSMITICNYDSYQSYGTTKEQKRNNKGTLEEHLRPTYNNDNNDNKEREGAIAPPKTKTFKTWSKDDFVNDIQTYKQIYPKDTLNAFFKYWVEKSASGRMRFQREDTWETNLRLDSWARREEKFNKTA